VVLTLVFLQKLWQLGFRVNEVAKRASHIFVVQNLADILNGFEKWHVDVDLSFERPIFGQLLTSLKFHLIALFFVLALSFCCLF